MTPMPISKVFRAQTVAALLLALVSWWALPCLAEPGGDAEFAALQAAAKDSFRDKAVPGRRARIDP